MLTRKKQESIPKNEDAVDGILGGEQGTANQFAFGRSHSAVDAVYTAVNTARGAINRSIESRLYCAVVTLDVQNAALQTGIAF